MDTEDRTRVIGISQFWRERQAEFEKYQQPFCDLKAHWNSSRQTWWLQFGESEEGILRPQQQSRRQHPLDVLKAVTRSVVAGCGELRDEVASMPWPRVSADAEPWQIWLDYMRGRSWGFRATGNINCNELEWDAGVKDGIPLVEVRKKLKPVKRVVRRRLYISADGGERIPVEGPLDIEEDEIYARGPDGSLTLLSEEDLEGKSSWDLERYFHWFEDGVVENVFQSSAHLCEDLAARAFERELRIEEPATRSKAERAPRTGGRPSNRPIDLNRVERAKGDLSTRDFCAELETSEPTYRRVLETGLASKGFIKALSRYEKRSNQLNQQEK